MLRPQHHGLVKATAAPARHSCHLVRHSRESGNLACNRVPRAACPPQAGMTDGRYFHQ